MRQSPGPSNSAATSTFSSAGAVMSGCHPVGSAATSRAAAGESSPANASWNLVEPLASGTVLCTTWSTTRLPSASTAGSSPTRAPASQAAARYTLPRDWRPRCAARRTTGAGPGFISRPTLPISSSASTNASCGRCWRVISRSAGGAASPRLCCSTTRVWTTRSGASR